MRCLRIYATPDGESHFDEIDIPTVSRAAIPGTVPFEISARYPASDIRFTRIPAAMHNVDYHTVPDGKGRLSHAGQEVRTRLEDAPLREIARRTGGDLILSEGRAVPLGERYRALADAAGDEDSPDRTPVYRQRQGWFLLPAFLLLCLGFVIPDRKGA